MGATPPGVRGAEVAAAEASLPFTGTLSLLLLTSQAVKATEIRTRESNDENSTQSIHSCEGSTRVEHLIRTGLNYWRSLRQLSSAKLVTNERFQRRHAVILSTSQLVIVLQFNQPRRSGASRCRLIGRDYWRPHETSAGNSTVQRPMWFTNFSLRSFG